MAFEYSGTVRDAFAARGHEAWSCDILETEQAAGFHIQDDVFNHIDDGWDMMIAHPPCTDIAISGAKWFELKRKDGRQKAGIDMFMRVASANINKICIENPVNIMSTEWRPPDQIIQPYYFGDEAQKTTWLWLKNLPKLIHVEKDDLFNCSTHVGKGEFVTTKSGKKLPKWYSNAHGKGGVSRGGVRAKTFPGIARAMAEQWG